MNIIPDRRTGDTPDYWCTWERQRYRITRGQKGSVHMNEALLFDGEEACVNYYPEIRSELYFVIDDGWDVPYDYDNNRHLLGSLDPDGERFPSLQGTQTQRLAQLNERVKAAGWRGLGLWVSASYTENKENVEYIAPNPAAESYWRDRVLMCREAGIEYWKVDWGNNGGSQSFRRMLTTLGHELYPELKMEHGAGFRPFNGTGVLGNCRFTQDDQFFCTCTGFSTFSDVMRTYDVSYLSISSTLDRIESYARTCRGIINCEDEMYIGAVLGCAVGIMRFPEAEGCDKATADERFHWSSLCWPKTYERPQEVLAAVRWHRAAPAFSGGEVYASDRLLTEIYDFPEPRCGMKEPGLIYQQAPAVISRRTALPHVINGHEKLVSFVAASLNPSGAYSIGAFRRQTQEGETVLPRVVCRPEECGEYAGIFGTFGDLILDYSGTGRRIASVAAQSLIEGAAEDLTEILVEDGMKIHITEELLNRFRNSADESEPAVILKLCWE